MRLPDGEGKLPELPTDLDWVSGHFRVDARTPDIAGAFVWLMGNGFVTGTLVHVDGGHRLV